MLAAIKGRAQSGPAPPGVSCSPVPPGTKWFPAQVLNAAELGRDAGLGRDQASAYLRLLELVYLVVVLPAWSVTLTARVTKRPKLHLVDSGLAAHLQGLTAERLSPVDPAAASRFGALLETFVVTEVLKQAGWASVPGSWRGCC